MLFIKHKDYKELSEDLYKELNVARIDIKDLKRKLKIADENQKMLKDIEEGYKLEFLRYQNKIKKEKFDNDVLLKKAVEVYRQDSIELEKKYEKLLKEQNEVRWSNLAKAEIKLKEVTDELEEWKESSKFYQERLKEEMEKNKC